MIIIDGEKVIINNKPIPHYRYLGDIGKGANGIVYLVEDMLKRKGALKIWMTLKHWDDRDKLKQGINETRKLLDAGQLSGRVIEIYHVGEIDSVFYAVLEYFDGTTLEKWLKTNHYKMSERCFSDSIVCCVNFLIKNVKGYTMGIYIRRIY